MILPRLSTTFVTCAKSDDGKDRDAGFADRQVLEQEVAAWLRHRNAKHAKADWRFTTATARIKLKRVYPTF